jgi:hypothetical protein
VQSGQNGIAEAFEERFLAFQHVLAAVDAKKDCALECRIIHHKRAVITITDIETPAGDNGIDL